MKFALCVAAFLVSCAPVFAQSIPEPVATATPAAVATVAPADNNRVLYPASNAQPTAAMVRGGGEAPGMSGLAASFLALLALCAGGVYLLRRQTGFALVGKGQRKLVVSESRSLGNRQFLVVVEYESERILVGVTPGKIDYLCPLPFKEQIS